MPAAAAPTDPEDMHSTPLALHPDERLLDAVSSLGRWLNEDQRRPAPERLALVLDGPLRSEVLAVLAPLERAAA